MGASTAFGLVGPTSRSDTIMSEHGSKEQSTKGIFDGAGEIAKVLENWSKDDQQRILRLVVEGLGLRDTSAEMLEALERGNKAASRGSAPRPAMDIRSFVDQKQPKSDVQFATVTAYYHRFEADESKRKDTITADDLQEAARLAQHDRFKEPYVPLQNAAIQGYLDRAGRGEFRINAVGENLVAMALPGGKENGPDVSSRRPAKRTRRRTSAHRKPKRSTSKR